jgi:hypothetical protein
MMQFNVEENGDKFMIQSPTLSTNMIPIKNGILVLILFSPLSKHSFKDAQN